MEKLTQGSRNRLWDNIDIDGTGDWIPEAIQTGSLVIAHDGSYKPLLDKSICSAGIVFVCTKTGLMGKISVCEQTDAITASNYRGELLGAMISSHIIRTASDFAPCGKTTRLYCDNMGVIHHALHPHAKLKSKQAQSDVLASFKRNLANTVTPWEYHHVYGHRDDNTEFSDLTLPEQLNVMADKLATVCLENAYSTGRYCTSAFPNEPICLVIDGRKITSSIKNSLYTSWGMRVARELFHIKRIIPHKHFDYVHWDGVREVMTSLPQMYKVWITKHVSQSCATRRHLSKMDPAVRNVCPCCGRRNETTLHITQCPDDGRRKMFEQSTADLLRWSQRNSCHPDIHQAVHTYLHHRGHTSMKNICSGLHHLSQFAQETDFLGWRNFMEAKVSKRLFAIQEEWLRELDSNRTIESWTRGFLTKLLDITHQQWLYRNARLHIRHVEGLTLTEHEHILGKVQSLIHTDPMALLPEHRDLLRVDYEALGQGSSVDRQYWVATVESALKAKRLFQTGHCGDRDSKRRRTT